MLRAASLPAAARSTSGSGGPRSPQPGETGDPLLAAFLHLKLQLPWVLLQIWNRSCLTPFCVLKDVVFSLDSSRSPPSSAQV